jgi:hypothetical protein
MKSRAAGHCCVPVAELVTPDHPPAIASRRLSGADKKEKERRKQQQARSRQHPSPEGLLLSGGSSALALHEPVRA